MDRRIRRGGTDPSAGAVSKRPAHRPAEDEARNDDPLLAKLAQLARFGLAAEAAPILVHSDCEEG